MLIGVEVAALFGSTYTTGCSFCPRCFAADELSNPLSEFQRFRSTLDINSCGSVTVISKDEAATVAAEAKLPNDPN